MSNRFAQVIILAEDERSANLLRRYVLRALNINNRRIRQIISPSAAGDAKQWVLRQYPIEVKELRGRHPKVALLAHLDADTDSVAKRTSELAAALKKQQLRTRSTDEWICHIIPRRHTETWLCALTGVDVNEEQDCKRENKLREFDLAVLPAANKLFDFTRQNAPKPPLPSISTAIPELRRLES